MVTLIKQSEIFAALFGPGWYWTQGWTKKRVSRYLEAIGGLRTKLGVCD